MPKYLVPVSYEKYGHITVEADSKADAIDQARKAWKGPQSIEVPSTEVDFAVGDDEDKVQLDEEDENEDPS